MTYAIGQFDRIFLEKSYFIALEEDEDIDPLELQRPVNMTLSSEEEVTLSSGDEQYEGGGMDVAKNFMKNCQIYILQEMYDLHKSEKRKFDIKTSDDGMFQYL